MSYDQIILGSLSRLLCNISESCLVKVNIK